MVITDRNSRDDSRIFRIGNELVRRILRRNMRTRRKGKEMEGGQNRESDWQAERERENEEKRK